MNVPAIRPNRDRAQAIIERVETADRGAVARPGAPSSVAAAAGSLAERTVAALEEVCTRGGRGSATIEATHRSSDGTTEFKVRLDVEGRR